jgi:hypothetical protein
MTGRLGHRVRSSGAGVRAVVVLTVIGFTSCGGATSSTVGSPSAISASSTTSVAATPTSQPASWLRMAPSPIRGDYYLPAAVVWDGNEMLVVVTQSDPKAYCTETLYSYDPSSGAWKTLSRVPTPKGCFEGSDKAVWTGRELLLWGISNAAYDPVADSWRHLPDPPTGDGGPSVVVWTGTQMIGWGGGCCDQELADGAAYTLATDSWKMLPPSPLLGRHAVGVWTGSEMIIAGGLRLRPAADAARIALRPLRRCRCLRTRNPDVAEAAAHAGRSRGR